MSKEGAVLIRGSLWGAPKPPLGLHGDEWQGTSEYREMSCCATLPERPEVVVAGARAGPELHRVERRSKVSTR